MCFERYEYSITQDRSELCFFIHSVDEDRRWKSFRRIVVFLHELGDEPIHYRSVPAFTFSILLPLSFDSLPHIHPRSCIRFSTITRCDGECLTYPSSQWRSFRTRYETYGDIKKEKERGNRENYGNLTKGNRRQICKRVYRAKLIGNEDWDLYSDREQISRRSNYARVIIIFCNTTIKCRYILYTYIVNVVMIFYVYKNMIKEKE